MNSIYLNDQLKNYYSECLNEELSLSNIDQGIQEHLLSISKSQNIRPIYSKKGKDTITRSLWSILTISFTNKVENKILIQIIPFMEKNFNLKGQYEFKYYKLDPEKRPGREITETNKGSKWLVDPDYFNINRIRFDLKEGTDELHCKFWDELSSQLTELD